MLSGKTLILGSGPYARDMAASLLDRGDKVMIATEDDTFDLPSEAEQAEIFTGTKLTSCRGSVGDFAFTLSGNGEKIYGTAASLVIAEEAGRKANFSHYGLSRSDRIISLSDLVKLLAGEETFSHVRKIVFLTGLKAESNPIVLEEIMEASLRLQSDFKVQTYVLTKNLKVAGNGLEALYRRTREAGTVYIKFTDTMPEIRQEEDGSLILLFTDEIMREKLSLRPDMTVVDERVLPSEYMGELAEILGLDTDEKGFPQSDNVHRIPVFTNRKGILVAGESGNMLSPVKLPADVGNVALRLRAEKTDDSLDKADIGPGCARCLSCYRVCPYRAIRIIRNKPEIMPPACEGCGLCAAICPACVIMLAGLAHKEVSEEIAASVPQKGENFIPHIVAFCCSRSAARAEELAAEAGYTFPRGLKIVRVPCAGSISHDHIFSAFRNNADGVLMLTCHEGNCHSEYGNIYAKNRAEQIGDFFSEAGFETERLLVKTLASNMAKEFADTVSCFEKQISELGPSRLGK
ncbi:MAG: hypothetical protein B6245_01600 [Desulfobacteraceae bacterium 4572_88]|nr:MAG: hypothetical protein B6245_01600 [Desulfobacteraceae bacterium 4572_88]